MKKIVAVSIVVLSMNVATIVAETESNSSNDLPSSFSWCDINGIDFTTPIKNQEPAPTCEAYALVAALETLVQYEVGYPFGCDLSEIHLFFYAGGTCDWGVNVKDAAEYLVEYGIPDEGCFPDPHRPYNTPFESLPGWENRTVKIREWGWVDNNVEAIKHALIDYGPLVICILQRQDFLVYKGGIYTPRWWQRIKTGHLVTIVGYDDSQQCWIVKNSAGENWGEKGYARVSYDAHNPRHPFIWPFYGGTGILYIDGVYGNFMPDVPKIYIENPKRHHTYFFGHELPTVFKKISFIQKGISRIIGWANVKINATNANKVEFYLDDDLQFVDEEPPYEWELHTSYGLHTIETLAYNERNVSKDIMDVFVLTS